MITASPSIGLNRSEQGRDTDSRLRQAKARIQSSRQVRREKVDLMAWKAKNLQQGQINEACHSSNGLQPNPSASALYYQDVTQERQKAKFCLSFLSSLVEGMMDTVLVVNPKTGLIEYANKAALRMFDCQFEDLIDHPPDIFCPLETTAEIS